MKIKYLIISILSLVVNNAFSKEIETLRESEFTPTLTNRFSFQAGLSPNLRQVSSVNNFNMSYATKRSDYWLNYNLQISRGLFEKMTINNPLATGSLANGLSNDRASHTAIGVGLMVESSYARHLFDMEELYETTSAYVAYNIFKTNSVTNTFTGPGVITNFSLCNKFTDYFSLGANLNYVLASVKRSANNNFENSSSQSLTLSYLTMGIDFIFTL
jgi:hypothetical protein